MSCACEMESIANECIEFQKQTERLHAAIAHHRKLAGLMKEDDNVLIGRPQEEKEIICYHSSGLGNMNSVANEWTAFQKQSERLDAAIANHRKLADLMNQNDNMLSGKAQEEKEIFSYSSSGLSDTDRIAKNWATSQFDDLMKVRERSILKLENLLCGKEQEKKKLSGYTPSSLTGIDNIGNDCAALEMEIRCLDATLSHRQKLAALMKERKCLIQKLQDARYGKAQEKKMRKMKAMRETINEKRAKLERLELEIAEYQKKMQIIENGMFDVDMLMNPEVEDNGRSPSSLTGIDNIGNDWAALEMEFQRLDAAISYRQKLAVLMKERKSLIQKLQDVRYGKAQEEKMRKMKAMRETINENHTKLERLELEIAEYQNKMQIIENEMFDVNMFANSEVEDNGRFQAHSYPQHERRIRGLLESLYEYRDLLDRYENLKEARERTKSSKCAKTRKNYWLRQ